MFFCLVDRLALAGSRAGIRASSAAQGPGGPEFPLWPPTWPDAAGDDQVPSCWPLMPRLVGDLLADEVASVSRKTRALGGWSGKEAKIKKRLRLEKAFQG